MCRPWFAALAAALLVAPTVTAAGPDVFLLLHPKCALDKGDAEQSFTRAPGKARREVYYPIVSATPRVVVGTGVKDVPRQGECFVIELSPTKVKPIARSVVGTPPGEVRPRAIRYVDVYLDQPYRVWYCKDADAKPELLGEAVLCGNASQWQQMGPERGALLPDTPAELARKASVPMHKDLGETLWDAYITRVVVAKPVAVMTAPEFWRRGGLTRVPPPVFKPSRVVAGPSGETVVEVVLHNRLPARVRCSLNRKMTPAEDAAWRQIPGQQQRPIPAALVHVDLEPGEKKTARFVVPALPNGVRLAAQSTFTASAVMVFEKRGR